MKFAPDESELTVLERVGVYTPFKNHPKTREGLRRALLDAKIKQHSQRSSSIAADRPKLA